MHFVDNYTPHINCIAALHREILMEEKLTIIDSKRFGKQNTLWIKNAVNDLYYARLC